MQNDGTAIWSHALIILTLQRKQCTGGLWRTIKQRTIIRCWAKLPRSFGTPTRPAYGGSRRFHGCIREVTYRSEGGEERLHHRRSRLLPVRSGARFGQ